MTVAIVFSLIYGFLSGVGGLIGYRQANSKVSLISGLVSGVLLLLGSLLMLQENPIGLWLVRGISAVLVVVFLSRLLKTKRWMPAGLMIAFGLATLIVSFVA